MMDIKKPEKPLELAFQAAYGTIVKYKWYAGGAARVCGTVSCGPWVTKKVVL